MIQAFFAGKPFMKKEIIFAIVILLFESISDAQDIAKNGVDAQKAKVVSRLYQATLGANERCKKAAPDASKEFQSELARFNLANANLMKLVRQSPYYQGLRIKTLCFSMTWKMWCIEGTVSAPT